MSKFLMHVNAILWLLYDVGSMVVFTVQTEEIRRTEVVIVQGNNTVQIIRGTIRVQTQVSWLYSPEV